jgi:hypothetical protein
MKPRVPVRRLILATLGLALLPGSVMSQEVTDRGFEIVKEMDRRSHGFEDFQAKLHMRIHDADGRVRVREMSVRGLESEDGDRTIMVLSRPADLSGTAFLSVLQGEGRRAQWMYLPAARRSRRIGGSQADDSFLGSHFTYGDMAPPSIEGFGYRWVRDEEVLGHSGAVVERCPSSCTEDAKRELLWIDTDRYLLHRVDYFDSAGVHGRTLLITGYEVVDGFRRAMHMEMAEMEDGGKTVLEWSELRLGVGLRERDFDPARLGEVR